MACETVCSMMKWLDAKNRFRKESSMITFLLGSIFIHTAMRRNSLYFSHLPLSLISKEKLIKCKNSATSGREKRHRTYFYYKTNWIFKIKKRRKNQVFRLIRAGISWRDSISSEKTLQQLVLVQLENTLTECCAHRCALKSRKISQRREISARDLSVREGGRETAMQQRLSVYRKNISRKAFPIADRRFQVTLGFIHGCFESIIAMTRGVRRRKTKTNKNT